MARWNSSKTTLFGSAVQASAALASQKKAARTHEQDLFRQTPDGLRFQLQADRTASSPGLRSADHRVPDVRQVSCFPRERDLSDPDAVLGG